MNMQWGRVRATNPTHAAPSQNGVIEVYHDLPTPAKSYLLTYPVSDTVDQQCFR
jgi:hypothetical protein